jgi:hypothetical protein
MRAGDKAVILVVDDQPSLLNTLAMVLAANKGGLTQ